MNEERKKRNYYSMKQKKAIFFREKSFSRKIYLLLQKIAILPTTYNSEKIRRRKKKLF